MPLFPFVAEVFLHIVMISRIDYHICKQKLLGVIDSAELDSVVFIDNAESSSVVLMTP